MFVTNLQRLFEKWWSRGFLKTLHDEDLWKCSCWAWNENCDIYKERKLVSTENIQLIITKKRWTIKQTSFCNDTISSNLTISKLNLVPLLAFLTNCLMVNLHLKSLMKFSTLYNQKMFFKQTKKHFDLSTFLNVKKRRRKDKIAKIFFTFW